MTIGTTVGETTDQSWAARGACPVRTECLADALDNRIDFGVWGGMTERERRRLLRRHPEVRDWAALLRRVEAEAVGG